MKKTMIIFGALLCAAALGACGSEKVKKENETDTDSKAVAAAEVENETQADDEMTGEEEMIGTDTEEEKEEEVLGLTLTAKDVSRTDMKLVFTQSGGNPSGKLYSGSYFRIERFDGGKWSEAPYTFDGETAWTAEAWGIPLDGTAEYPEKWIYYCGILPNGAYRIAKEIDDFREPGDFDKHTYYAGFEITDDTPAARINVDGVTFSCKGEISEFDRTCGTMDGFTAASVPVYAKELAPGQSNFGEGFGYQRVSDTQYDVLIGSIWYAFIKEGSDAKPVKPTYASEVICPLGEDAVKTAFPITAEESVTLHNIIAGADWVEGTADCINDYRIDLSDVCVYYHTECGTFNDTARERSFTLDDETHELVNRIVFQYAGKQIQPPAQMTDAEEEIPELCGLPRKEDTETR